MSSIFTVPGSKWFHVATDPITGVVGGNMMSSNPIPTGTRPQPTRIKRDTCDVVDIYFPLMSDIKPGMRIAAYWRKDRSWGQEVSEVDVVKQKILIRNYIGGTMDRAEWVPYSRVWVVWG